MEAFSTNSILVVVKIRNVVKSQNSKLYRNTVFIFIQKKFKSPSIRNRTNFRPRPHGAVNKSLIRNAKFVEYDWGYFVRHSIVFQLWVATKKSIKINNSFSIISRWFWRIYVQECHTIFEKNFMRHIFYFYIKIQKIIILKYILTMWLYIFFSFRSIVYCKISNFPVKYVTINFIHVKN